MYIYLFIYFNLYSFLYLYLYIYITLVCCQGGWGPFEVLIIPIMWVYLRMAPPNLLRQQKMTGSTHFRISNNTP